MGGGAVTYTKNTLKFYWVLWSEPTGPPGCMYYPSEDRVDAAPEVIEVVPDATHGTSRVDSHGVKRVPEHISSYSSEIIVLPIVTPFYPCGGYR